MRLTVLFMVILLFSSSAMAAQKRIVVLGDSLTAGYGLQSGEDFVTKLQEAMVADGNDVKIDNAGVSGDTTAGGRARLDWAIQGEPAPSLIIVALGGNDMLRGIDPEETRENLSAILSVLKAKNIPALLAGMKAPANLGLAYRKSFESVYDDLAKQYDVAYYPFFLEGVAMKQDLNLADGIHPNTKGIEVMVKNILPIVKKSLK
jgi:acyl-CoA thioesterase-1